MRCIFLTVSSPKLDLLSPFLYIIILQRWESFKLSLAPLRGEINFEQVLFKAFFDVMRIFGSIKPQAESTFPLLFIIIFQRWEFFDPLVSLSVGDRHMCS